MIQLAFTDFLFGVLGIGLPIILHLIRKKPTELTMFPAFQFLHKSIVSKHSRNNIRKWIILMLRCLAFILLSLAFAWPYLPNFARAPESITVILWDNSFSMGAKPYYEEMSAKALDLINQADNANPILIGLVSERITWSPKFSGDASAMADFFKKNIPGEGSSSFGTAILQGDAMLQEMSGKKKQIIIFTDKQKLPWRNVSFHNPLAPGVALTVVNPQKPGFSNASITSVRNLTLFNKAGNKIVLAVQLKNYSEKTISGNLRTYLENKLLSSDKVEIKAGGEVTEMLSVTPHKLTSLPVRLEFVTDDDIEVDNRRFFPLNPVKLPQIAINGDSNKFDFVRLCYQTSKHNQVAKLRTLSKTTIRNADFIILRKSISLNSSKGQALQKAVEEGKNIAVIWNNSPAMRNFLLHFGIKSSIFTEEKTERFGSVDFNHPVFKRFLDVKIGSFFDIAFFSPPKIQLPKHSRILAEFSNGTPAIAEIDVVRGKLIFIASSLDRKSANWAVHSTFLPFMRELLNYCKTGKKDEVSFVVGATIKIAPYDEVIDIKNGTILATGSTFSPDQTGNYILKNKGSKKIISVNTLPEESKSQLLPDTFNTSVLVSKNKVPNQIAASTFLPPDQGKAFWWIILIVAAMIIVSELLLANRTAL